MQFCLILTAFAFHTNSIPSFRWRPKEIKISTNKTDDKMFSTTHLLCAVMLENYPKPPRLICKYYLTYSTKERRTNQTNKTINAHLVSQVRRLFLSHRTVTKHFGRFGPEKRYKFILCIWHQSPCYQTLYIINCTRNTPSAHRLFLKGKQIFSFFCLFFF